MLFRFSISKSIGSDSCYDQQFNDVADAKVYTRYLLREFRVINSVTVHQHLTDDSCGPIKFIGTFVYDGTKVFNRETMEIL